MSARVIDGKAVAAAVRREVASGVAEFQREHGRTPGLATVLIGEDKASAVYVGSKHRACEEVGMRSIGHTLPADTGQEDAVALIERLNADPGRRAASSASSRCRTTSTGRSSRTGSSRRRTSTA